MSLPEGSVWNQIIKLTKAAKERRLVEELQRAAAHLQSQIQSFNQSKALLEQYEAVWRQLLVCRRSDLMCCIPLTSQRIGQLVTVVSTTAAAAQAAMSPVQSLLSTLGAYASVNKSTAEELQQTPETALMAADKLQLSVLEEQLITALQRLIATSWHCTRQQQQLEPVSVAPARTVSAEAANSLGGTSPATLSAGHQAVNPASAAAPAMGAQSDRTGVAASSSSLQQILQGPLQQQVALVQGAQQQPPPAHHHYQQQLQQHNQQQPTLQQQQHVLQQRQQQLELQLQQMGQLLQQQQRHGEQPQHSSTDHEGNANLQDYLHQPLQRVCSRAQVTGASPSGNHHQQGQQQQHQQQQQQHPSFLQLPPQQMGGNSSAGAPVAAAVTAGRPERLGPVPAADAVGQLLRGSAAIAAAVSVDDVDTGMVGSSLPSQEPPPSAAAVDTRTTAAAVPNLCGPKGATSSGQLPSTGVQHFAVQGTHVPAAGSRLTAEVPGNRLLADAVGWSSKAFDAGPHTQAGPWDRVTY